MLRFVYPEHYEGVVRFCRWSGKVSSCEYLMLS
ncbi:hypothetical protein T02_15733 [Trichinella nativa]|uniref:Uncharacterized protein n=1 Tax=Trichinella nativa TaxID=6335 RepID=A0A0V1KKD0_9BILA|nr:hypothetical protein T02_15733 [Trichinella nativa]